MRRKAWGDVMRKTVALLSAVLGTAGALAGSAFAADAVLEWNSIKAEAPPELKPVTIDAAKTGVMVMDFNKANCNAQMRVRCHAQIPKVQKVLNAARAKGMTIVFIRTQNMKPEDFVEAVAPRPGEPYLVGTKEDKLWANDAERIFREKGVDTLLLMGHQANGSVMVTALGAAMRGFKVIAPVDTMSAATAYQEQFAIWEIANGPAFRGLSTLTRSDMLSF
jgi:nicotinamidase-related amidase